MLKVIPNTIPDDRFESMRERVLKMNTNIEDFVQNEMLHHKDFYNPVVGARLTGFAPSDDNVLYLREPLIASDGALLNCEFLVPRGSASNAILYVHGAAFQRRSNDINLKTADRLCAMTKNTVCIPDYRVGADYTYDQMVSDVVASYKYLTLIVGFEPENITILADSSGCVTALQALRKIEEEYMLAPGKVVLWSPQADEKFDAERIAEGKKKDIALQTNELFVAGFDIYLSKMGAGKTPKELYPVYGNFDFLEHSKVLIQAGADELLIEDAYKLHDKFEKICPCTLEVYEKMFHNFQTYYSICETAKTCWQRVVSFITEREGLET